MLRQKNLFRDDQEQKERKKPRKKRINEPELGVLRKGTYGFHTTLLINLHQPGIFQWLNCEGPKWFHTMPEYKKVD